MALPPFVQIETLHPGHTFVSSSVLFSLVFKLNIFRHRSSFMRTYIQNISDIIMDKTNNSDLALKT